MPKSQKYKSKAKSMKIKKKSNEQKKNKQPKKPKGPKKSKKSKKPKKKLNAFMKELQKAKANDDDEFDYNGKKYVKDYAKTGMVIYKGKK